MPICGVQTIRFLTPPWADDRKRWMNGAQVSPSQATMVDDLTIFVERFMEVGTIFAYKLLSFPLLFLLV